MTKLNSKVVNSVFILLILTTIGNGINYCFQIAMGRMLSVVEFGTLNALLSFFMMSAVPSGAITALTAKYLVKYNSTDNKQMVSIFIFRVLRAALIGSLIVFMIGLIFSPTVSRYLNISSVGLVLYIMILISLNILFVTIIGIAQGLKYFSALGLLGVVLPGLKLTLGIIWVALGFKIFGALMSIIIALILTIGFGLIYIRQKTEISDQADIKLDTTAYFQFFTSAFLLSASLSILTNLDMMLISHYLSRDEAGYYGPAMILGRIILYAPAALVLVMYPLVIESHAADPRNTYKLILKVLLFTTLIIVACVGGLWLISGIAVPLLFGEKFINSTIYVLPASLFVVPICYLTVLMNYAMAVGGTRFLTVTIIIGCLLSFLLVEFDHSSVPAVLSTMTLIGLAVVLVNVAEMTFKYRKSYNNEASLI